MSHAVHFRDASGEPQLEDATSLDAALERVEDLRNTDGATEIRVFREVPIEVRTYYRVVVAEQSPDQVPVSDHTRPAPAARAPEAGAESAFEPVEQLAQGAVGPPPSSEPMEPPSGAMVMSRQPVGVAVDASSGESGEHAAAPNEHRRLFNRGS